jgi:heme exporter protein C
VPLNFTAVRLAEPLSHPRVLDQTGGSLEGSMRLTLLVCLAGMVSLFVTLWKYELASKHATFRLRGLRRKLAAASDEELFAPTPRRSAAPQL